MTAEEFKLHISEKTGIPIHLLKGETPEEDLIHAQALLAYKKEAEKNRPKTPREQFAEWLNQQDGATDPETDNPLMALKEKLRIANGGYPIVRDGGTPEHTPAAQREPREEFAEWFASKTAFNPFRDSNGWTHLT